MRATALCFLPFVLLLTGFASPGTVLARGPSGLHDGSPTFSVVNTAGASWFQLWIEGDSGPVHDRWYEAKSICGGLLCTIDPQLALADGSYRWWMRAWLGTGNGPWTPATPFDVVTPRLHWIDHLAFRPSTSVTTSFDSIDSGVGSGTSGLIVEGVGSVPGLGPPRLLEQALRVPPGMHVTGVRLCYELTDPATHVSSIRIDQLQEPGDQLVTSLLYGPPFQANGPICEDSDRVLPPIDASKPLRLQLLLGLPFGVTGDRIVIRGLGLYLLPDPADPANQ